MREIWRERGVGVGERCGEGRDVVGPVRRR